MDSDNDVQSLLCGLENDQGEELERRHPPYSQPFNQTRSTRSSFETARTLATESGRQQRRIYEPLQQSFPQAPDTVGLSPYGDPDNIVLDDYGKCLC